MKPYKKVCFFCRKVEHSLHSGLNLLFPKMNQNALKQRQDLLTCKKLYFFFRASPNPWISLYIFQEQEQFTILFWHNKSRSDLIRFEQFICDDFIIMRAECVYAVITQQKIWLCNNIGDGSGHTKLSEARAAHLSWNQWIHFHSSDL